MFTQRRVALRFRSTTFRKRGRVATAKVTFSNKSAPVLCKRNAVLLLFSAVFRPIRSSVNVSLKGKPNSHTVTHIDDMVDTPFNGRSNNILDFSKVGDSYQINFDVTPKLVDGIYAYEMDIVLTSSRGYDIMLLGDCGGSGYNASTKYKYWNWSTQNKIFQNNVQGGHFQRATGKKVHVKGSFLNLGSKIHGQEIALSMDYENGITYEFVMQRLESRNAQDHVLGSTIYFVFEPDNQKTMEFTSKTYFSFKRLLKL